MSADEKTYSDALRSWRSIPAKMYLITYSRCEIALKIIMNLLLACPLIKDVIQYMLIASETHKDEGLHRHVLLILKEPRSFKKVDVANEFDIFEFSYLNDLNSDVVEDYKLFCDWKNLDQARKNQYKKFHPNVERKKDLKKIIKYVRKQNGEFIEYGDKPNEDNEREDRAKRNLLLINSPIKRLIEDGEISLLSLPQLKKARQIYYNELYEDEIEKPKIFWFYGETGSGKSYYARKQAMQDKPEGCSKRDWYWVLATQSSSGTCFFDGYHGQPIVILDDLRAGTINWNGVLQITDVYQDSQVAIKGDFANWQPRRIYITAPGVPRDVFKNRETGEPWDKIDQLERRITELRHFWKDDKEFKNKVEHF